MTADCAFGWCIEYCPDIYQIQVNSIYTLIEYDKFVIEYKQNIQCEKSCIEYWKKNQDCDVSFMRMSACVWKI